MKHARLSFVLAVGLLPVFAGMAGAMLGSGMLHPMRRELSPELIARADQAFTRVHATREDFEVRAPDGVLLRGWKVRFQQSNGDWVMLFHGVSDNRVGMHSYAEFLLRHGYSVLLMDARAHGASEGPLATYGWLERHDTSAIAGALFASEQVHCFFLLGESMGASIALQSAAEEPRVSGVVAESAFANLREVSFDYAGLRLSSFLGRTLFRPASTIAIRGAEKEGGFKADDISPEKAVAARAFPVLLICGLSDRNIPARHTKRIYKAAIGPKEMWLVKGAGHTAVLGKEPLEFERRVLTFFGKIHDSRM
ncbi:MAG: alpha/beta hydrolase [Acidobacteria bacterium]|nr:alpha/beta hydrolase [Acidobacteriota bacterium]MCL5288410.1 alpha/beta hydrolase [Acidobacteriota bacterium]